MSSQQRTKVNRRYTIPCQAFTGSTVISTMKTERGLALQDLLTGAYEYVESIELKPHARVYLLDYLATTECVVSWFDPRILIQICFQAPAFYWRQ